MATDWLIAAKEAIGVAEESRREVEPNAPALTEGGTATLERALPAAQRHNRLFDASMDNAIDALIIAGAQEEAGHTGRREHFMLAGGQTGAVDSAGFLYDERPPQG